MSAHSTSNAHRARSSNVFEIRPFPCLLGAEVICGDLRDLTGSQLEVLYNAWLDHLVLLFRGQTLSDEDLIAFTCHFGEFKDPLPARQREAGVERTGNPRVSVISNVVENGVAIGVLGDGEAQWHGDYSFDERPYAGAILYALEVPPTGGATGWSNMYVAFETLPNDLRERVSGLTIKQDASYNAAGMLRRGYEPVTDVRTSPGPSHPIVWTHPETGHDTLYLGRRRLAHVNGLELGESEELLDRLWAHAEKPEFQWHNKWQVGDLVLWDNRCTMHYRQAFPPDSRRVMHRTSIVGTSPIHLPSGATAGPHARAHLKPQ